MTFVSRGILYLLIQDYSMKEEIPKIHFDSKKSLDIEVMNFPQLLEKLDKIEDHDPFAVHKIKFFLVLIITKNSYSHFVDFKPYQLKEGSALFIAKNQVHHFTKDLQTSEGICILFNSLFINKDYFLSDNLKLNRLYNYHIETPIIHQKQMRKDNLIDIASKLYSEYIFSNRFAKSEILRALLHVLLLKAERAKEFKSISVALKSIG